jgi:TolB-like protein/Tfp pilus assembly protein PilF
LKESILGPIVFDRNSEYDPKIDSIVRVYAGRLRVRLDHYYRQAGTSSALRICLPTGGYVPQFEPRRSTIAEPEIVSNGIEPVKVGVPPTAKRRRLMMLISVLSLVIAGTYTSWSLAKRSATSNGPRDSIAVLPFIDLTGEQAFRYFEDGLTEELINSLAHVPGLRVISRTSSFMFRGQETDIRTIGAKLDVSTILEGSVRRRGSGLRISAQLIDVRNGSELWSESFDRELKDTVLIQEDISRAIITNLKAGPLTAATTDPSNRHVPSIDAYDAYLKGRYLWFRVTPRDFRAAASQFEDAIKLDPSYAPSYMALAQAYSGIATFGAANPRDAWPKSKAMAVKAIQLDSTLGEAHTTLAGVYANYDWDQAGADAEYKRGVELAPGSSIAHQFYASFLGSQKRWSEADAQMSEARRLDPLWNLGIWGDAQLYYWEGRLDEADRRVQELIIREPNFVTSYDLKAQIHLQRGSAAGAIAIMEEAPDVVKQTPRWIGRAGYFYALAGNSRQAQDCLSRLNELAKQEVVPPYLSGLIYQALGDKNRAIQLISEALDERSLRPGWIAVDPMFNSMRSDSRFQALIRRVGL